MKPAKEYYVHCGNYRKFIVIADNKKQARQRFVNADPKVLIGFTEKDITSIEPMENKQ